MINSIQIQSLKAFAHHLKPVVQIGKNGVSASLIREIENSLAAHELIKIQLSAADKDALNELASSLCQQTGAQLVEVRGKIATIFKPFPEDSAKKSILDLS